MSRKEEQILSTVFATGLSNCNTAITNFQCLRFKEFTAMHRLDHTNHNDNLPTIKKPNVFHSVADRRTDKVNT